MQRCRCSRAAAVNTAAADQLPAVRRLLLPSHTFLCFFIFSVMLSLIFPLSVGFRFLSVFSLLFSIFPSFYLPCNSGGRTLHSCNSFIVSSGSRSPEYSIHPPLSQILRPAASYYNVLRSSKYASASLLSSWLHRTGAVPPRSLQGSIDLL